jgi:gliding motility-associated lipoprotein GldD
MVNNYRSTIVLFLFCTGLFACNSDYIIKQRGYFKIPLPKKAYQSFNIPSYPYTFEYPLYGKVVKDTSFFDQQEENDYWINIDFPQFQSRMHISYKKIGKENQFDSLVNDAFTMSYKQHTYKASAIEPVPFTTPTGIEGIFFTLKGNTATANQFFVTDTSRHFLRGALYFDATPNEDSLLPVNQFLKKDLEHLINTLQWR